MAEPFLTTVKSVIEVQIDGLTGNRAILDVTNDVRPALEGWTKGLGAITRGYRRGPTGASVPRPVRRGDTEDITTSMEFDSVASNYMEQLDADSRFALYVRHTTSHPANPLSYARVDILTDVAIEGIEYGTMSAKEGDEENITHTVNLNAANHVRILPVEGRKLSTGWAENDDNNVLDAAVDDDGVIYLLTAVDSVDGYSYLVKSADGGLTWTETALTAVTANPASIAVCGNYLLVGYGTTIAVYSKTGVASTTSTVAANVALIRAIDAANAIAVGASGMIVMTDDGGTSWSTVTSGVATALSSIAIRNINEWFVGGASGTLLKYDSGTVSAVTPPSSMAAATIGAIAVPDSKKGFTREETVAVGASTGDVYISADDGDTWTQVAFPGDGAGAIADLKFTEFLGQVLYILHTPAAGSSVVWRDWSGGVGGNNNVESVTVPTNSGLTELVPFDANLAFVFGNVHSSDEMVVKISE